MHLLLNGRGFKTSEIGSRNELAVQAGVQGCVLTLDDRARGTGEAGALTGRAKSHARTVLLLIGSELVMFKPKTLSTLREFGNAYDTAPPLRKLRPVDGLNFIQRVLSLVEQFCF